MQDLSDSTDDLRPVKGLACLFAMAAAVCLAIVVIIWS